jgi:hypothetical protein
MSRPTSYKIKWVCSSSPKGSPLKITFHQEIYDKGSNDDGSLWRVHDLLTIFVSRKLARLQSLWLGAAIRIMQWKWWILHRPNKK